MDYYCLFYLLNINEKVSSNAHFELGIAQLAIAIYIQLREPGLNLKLSRAALYKSSLINRVGINLSDSKLVSNQFAGSLGFLLGQEAAAVTVHDGEDLPDLLLVDLVASVGLLLPSAFLELVHHSLRGKDSLIYFSM